MGSQKKMFYEADTYTGQLRAGIEISVRRAIRYKGENADFKPFLTVPQKELGQRLKDSMAEEKKIYDELQRAIKAWDEHGAQTLLLQKAIEYLKTEPVKHTANEWKQHKDGTWEISNMVYQMTFKIVKHGDEWKLSWELQYTAPGRSKNHYYSYCDGGPKKRIEYEGSKKYKTMAGAQKYIQSKFDQYANYFETLSPPIPESAQSLFCVNGQLLQGYSTAHPEGKEIAVTVDDLLACLDIGDTGEVGSEQIGKVPEDEPPPELSQEQTAQPSPTIPPPPPSPKHPAVTKKTVHKKAKLALVR